MHIDNKVTSQKYIKSASGYVIVLTKKNEYWLFERHMS